MNNKIATVGQFRVDSYEQFQRIVDSVIHIDTAKPVDKTSRRTIIEPKRAPINILEIRKNTSSLVALHTMMALATVITINTRKFIASLRDSATPFGRKKTHFMSDYMSGDKRCVILADKLERCVFKYYDTESKLVSDLDNSNACNSQFDVYEVLARFVEADSAIFNVHIEKFKDVLSRICAVHVKPIDPVVFNEMMTNLYVLQQFCNLLRSFWSTLHVDSHNSFMIISDMYEPLVELFNRMCVSDKVGRRLYWIASQADRKKWIRYASNKKKYFGKFKMSSLNPVDVATIMSEEPIERSSYELLKKLFDLKTIDEMNRIIDNNDTRYSDAVNCNFLQCMHTFEEYRLSVCMKSFDYKSVARYMVNLSDDVKNNFYAGFNLDEHTTFKGLWLSSSFASDDCCVPEEYIRQSAKLNTYTPECTSYYHDGHGTIWLDFPNFYNHILSLCRKINLIEPVDMSIKPISV